MDKENQQQPHHQHHELHIQKRGSQVWLHSQPQESNGMSVYLTWHLPPQEALLGYSLTQKMPVRVHLTVWSLYLSPHLHPFTSRNHQAYHSVDHSPGPVQTQYLKFTRVTKPHSAPCSAHRSSQPS